MSNFVNSNPTRSPYVAEFILKLALLIERASTSLEKSAESNKSVQFHEIQFHYLTVEIQHGILKACV